MRCLLAFLDPLLRRAPLIIARKTLLAACKPLATNKESASYLEAYLMPPQLGWLSAEQGVVSGVL